MPVSTPAPLEVTPLRLLIADDSEEDRYSYRRLLSRTAPQRFTLEEAATGAATLERCKAAAPDCLLLDYRFPDMTGIEVLEGLAAAGLLARIAVVMLTGQGNEAIAVAAMKLGVQDYLSKRAVSADALRCAISSAVEKVQLRHEIEEQREALVRSHRELERFACVVAHDLQTPLTGMTMFLSILRQLQSPAGDSQAQRYLDMALDASERMRRLIADLLHFSRAGARAGSFEPVDLGRVAREVRGSLAGLIAETGATLEIGDLPTVPGHRTELGQVLQNLVENALRYRSAAPPRVAITASRDGDIWQLCVADNGIGIAKEHHAQVFEPFQRLHRYDEIPGNGLGLAICKKVVEYHGGRIWIESAPGEGTAVHFTLPAA